jgi:hypothetical protein
VKEVLADYDGYDGYTLENYSQIFRDILLKLVYQDKNIKCFKKSHIYNIYEKCDDELKLVFLNDFAFPFQKVLYFNLVDAYSIDNGIIEDSLVASKISDWIGLIINQIGLGNKIYLEGADSQLGASIWKIAGREILSVIRKIYHERHADKSDYHLHEYEVDGSGNLNEYEVDETDYYGLDIDFKKNQDLSKGTNGFSRFTHKFSLDKCREDFVEHIVNEKTIYINELICHHYFDSNFISSINERALLASEKCIDCLENLLEDPHGRAHNSSKYNDKDIYSYKNLRAYLDGESQKSNEYTGKSILSDSEHIDNIDKFFIPVLEKDTVLYTLFKRLKQDYKAKSGIYRSPLLDPISEFYYAEIKKLKGKANRSKEVVIFEDLLRKYINDKEIVICPAGLYLYKKSTNSKAVERIEQKDKLLVDLSFLSSGEKKLIMLLSLVIFIKDRPIFLDEPELSLSFLWQEQLLPDILHISNTHTFVATHSPYMAADDELEKYIVFLPMEVKKNVKQQ